MPWWASDSFKSFVRVVGLISLCAIYVVAWEAPWRVKEETTSCEESIFVITGSEAQLLDDLKARCPQGTTASLDLRELRLGHGDDLVVVCSCPEL